MRSEWTLSEAALVLGEPQHKLIYLCEKEIIIPDLGQATGRGSSRRFSGRNLLEFALALNLGKLMIHTQVIGAIIRVLRTFEKRVAKEMPDFSLFPGLVGNSAPELRVVIRNGQKLFFTLGKLGAFSKAFGGIDFHKLVEGKAVRVNALRGRTPADDEKEDRSRVILDITRIAKELKSKL